MYTSKNFRSKKELKEAVQRYTAGEMGSFPVTYFQPGPFAGHEPMDGLIYLEGPHYPEAHKWYAQAEVENGVIVSVK